MQLSKTLDTLPSEVLATLLVALWQEKVSTHLESIYLVFSLCLAQTY